ncbi:MAG: 1-acyl-sn-glycerol-3-phosphate acyltransferase [Muribaculaceae bacterium]|nr:1-acyl-sn-glycerol-3-phosphate acyltransferase [Muribaculaceae bacterium]
MNLWGLIFKGIGWKTDITVPYRDKAVICVAPHTSNWDFIMGLLAYRSVGRKASFLMKEFWFFFPLKYLFYALGGIPVKENPKTSLTASIIEDFKQRNKLNLAVTPEGSRSAVDKWRTGFLTIAYNAHVPIQLGVIDFKNKVVIIRKEYIPTGNNQDDLKEIRKYYSDFKDAALYPEKFVS